MNQRKRIAIIAVAALMVGGILGTVYWRHRADEAQAKTITLYGNVDIREVQLAFEVSGRVDSVDVDEGDRVTRGQTLAALDTSRLQHAVDQLQGQTDAQAQQVAAMHAGTRPEDIKRARAEVAAAAAREKEAQLELTRTKNLHARNVASQARLDAAQAGAEAATAQLQATRQALALAVAGPRREDIAAAEAGLRANRAALALAQENLADAALTAPAPGIVRARILEPGDMASPQRPAFTLALTDPLWVRVYIPETELGRIRPGMSAAVTTDSFPGKHYAAWVGSISPTSEFTPKTVETTEVRSSLVYQARVFVCDPAGQLRLGMPATVKVDTTAPVAPDHGCDR